MSDQKCKTCRRAGEKLFLKGEKCFTPKCTFEKRPTPPGKPQSERKHRSMLTEYGIQLREKQKIRNVYGVSEKQFSSYVKQAGESKEEGSPVEKLFNLLERRLDNVVFRLGFAASRTQARQMVSHGHFMVGKHKLTIPSYRVHDDDVITVREGSRTSPLFAAVHDKIAKHPSLNWIEIDSKTLTAKIKGTPKYDKNELGFNFQSVIEFYSR